MHFVMLWWHDLVTSQIGFKAQCTFWCLLAEARLKRTDSRVIPISSFKENGQAYILKCYNVKKQAYSWGSSSGTSTVDQPQLSETKTSSMNARWQSHLTQTLNMTSDRLSNVKRSVCYNCRYTPWLKWLLATGKVRLYFHTWFRLKLHNYRSA